MAGQFQILPAMNMLSDFGVFDAVPLGGSLSTEEIATAVKLDAAILGEIRPQVAEARGHVGTLIRVSQVASSASRSRKESSARDPPASTSIRLHLRSSAQTKLLASIA